MIWVEEGSLSDQETAQSKEVHETDLLRGPENEKAPQPTKAMQGANNTTRSL